MANIITVRGWTPRIHPTAWVAPTATLIGKVEIGAGANVWFGAVLRGDQSLIRIGERSSVQDNSVLHCNEEHDTIVGADVTIGHGAVLEGCTIHDWALIGMNAVVLDGCVVGKGALIAAGAVVKERDEIPEWTLAAGIPAKPRKKLEGMALETVQTAAAHYQKLMALYEHLGQPVAGTPGGE
ncbi:MAG: gamma carbonic anhydrase family protein [Gemmatimonadota bacterium]|nr:MAG: gamma carbonic anhydrase family protein [Gemmatimonadota bacterium]